VKSSGLFSSVGQKMTKRNTKDDLVMWLAVIGLPIIGIVLVCCLTYFSIKFEWHECRIVGHSKLYCFMHLGHDHD
jgi:hypothetical protein